MATVTRPTDALPDPGDALKAEPVRDHINNILTFLESNNIDSANVDYSSTDGIMVLDQAQTVTGAKNFSSSILLSGSAVVDLNGIADSLVLDEDGDTTLSSPTDDQIDVEVGGSDLYKFTATAFVSGSNIVSDTTNTDSLGTTAITWSDLYLGDAAVLAFGEDQDVTLTHSADAGIFLNAGMKLGFRDMGGEYIYSVSDGTLGIAAATEVDITTTTLDVNGAVDISGNTTVGGSLNIGASTAVSNVKDEDNMSSNSATSLATQQSIKAYVDAQVAGADTIAELSDTDITSIASANILIYDGSNSWDNKAMSGDATIATTGAVTLAGTNTNLTTLANVTTVGTIGTGVWQGTAIASAYLDSDTAHLTGTQTFTGDKTFTGTVTVGVDGTGKDVKLFGDTSGAYILWDESADKLLTAGAAVVDIVKDKLLIGGTAVTTTAAELNTLDAVLAGTASASKALVVDSNKDIAALRNVSLTGELDAATLDISGNADIDGTTNLDAVDIDGATQMDGTVTVGVDDTGYDVKFFGDSAGAYMEWDASADQLRIVGASADATTSTGKLLLATALNDINANDVIGKIEWQAPLEVGADAISVSASIKAIAQSTFTSTSNATDLIFSTGHSETATEKFRITSQGELGVGGANYGTDGQVLTSGGAGAAPAWEDAAGGGHTIQEEGSSLTQRANLNFVGAAVTATDNSGADTTIVTIGAENASLPLTRSDGSTSDPITLSSVAVGQDLSSDSTPQLGGNLDVNGQSIVSTSNGNIQITPNGTGSVLVGVDDTGHDVKFFGATSNRYMLWDESGDLLNLRSDLSVFRGSNGTDRRFFVDESSGGVSFNTDSGSVAPDGHVHIHSGSAGSVSASVHYDDLVVEGSGNTGISILAPEDYTSGIALGSNNDNDIGYIYAQHSGTAGSRFMAFGVNAAERMRIDSSGNVLIGTTDTTNAGRFKVENSDGEYTAAFFNSHGSSPYGLFFNFTGAAPDNSTTNHFLHCKDTSADRLKIWSDGDVANHDGTYGTLSDAKLKQDITDMRSYWGDFKSLQYRKYRHKSDVAVNVDAPYRIGLVAQEVDPVFPSLVVESADQEQQDVAVLDEDGNATYEQTEKLDADGNAELDADGNTVMIDKVDDDGNKIAITEKKMVDLGTTTKWVKSSIIEGPIMASVVQELQARLESAEAKIAALEAA